MVTKSQIKLITSLQQKKNRIASGLFIAEGIKVINELLNSSFTLHHLYVEGDNIFDCDGGKVTYISASELKKISNLKTPNKALALFHIPEPATVDNKALILALDDVRDPGNLGTIIRLCDWFGIKDLVCSMETVDCFNPKVVQATMGSLSRVNISYLPLEEFLKQADLPVLIADMDGENVYNTALPAQCILVMGNEANGISESVAELSSLKVTIPRFGEIKQTESLNVATATSILLSEFKRRY